MPCKNLKLLTLLEQFQLLFLYFFSYNKAMKRKRKKRMTLHEKAMIAMKKAVKKVMAEHKKDGQPIAVWSNGKVKKEFVK